MYHVKYYIPPPFFFPNQTKPQPNPSTNHLTTHLTNPLTTHTTTNPIPQSSTLQKKEESHSTESKLSF
jgi:hypothetical protein